MSWKYTNFRENKSKKDCPKFLIRISLNQILGWSGDSYRSCSWNFLLGSSSRWAPEETRFKAESVMCSFFRI